MSNHETEEEVIIQEKNLKTDDGFSEKKMALKVDKVLVQLSGNKPKLHKKVKQEKVIYEEK